MRAPATRADCGSSTLIFRSEAKAEAVRREIKNRARSAKRGHIWPPLHAKGVDGAVCAGLLARENYDAAAFPCSLTVTAAQNNLAYSCAAARASHPLPSPCRAARARIPNTFHLERSGVRNLLVGQEVVNSFADMLFGEVAGSIELAL